VLEDGEQCEGGDVLKCKDCIIQDGFMCPDAVRDTDFQNVLGKKVALKDNNGVETLIYVIDPATNNSMPETCLGELLCTSDLYSPVNDEVTVPYKGYYCPTVCEKFPVPEWFEYKESSSLTPIDECADGTSDCDINAFSEETADGIGFKCACDKDFFTGKIGGKECLQSGAEIRVHAIAKSAPSNNADAAVVFRTEIVSLLMQKEYIRQGTGYELVTVDLIR